MVSGVFAWSQSASSQNDDTGEKSSFMVQMLEDVTCTDDQSKHW